MTLDAAITRLHAHGYRASPSGTLPGYITVLDPSHARFGGESVRIVYDRRTIHPSQVIRFLIDRCEVTA